VNSLPDEQLLKLYRSGDSSALGVLLERYQSRLYNSILRICKNHDDAMELSADAFVKAIENVERFEQASGFYTWLFRIGVNGALNFVRRKSRFKFFSFDGFTDAEQSGVYEPGSAAPGPAEDIERKERETLLTEALGRLEPNHRTVIVLRDIEQMSYEEIAAVLSISLGTVKSRLFRAREALRNELRDYYEND
jgi:RNA polymerase sigma-70 factor (ECF subfamily)